MPETNWGRKETIIWPPHSPIYTFGAVFLGLILTGLFVYLRFAFALTPLQQFYLPALHQDLHRAEPSPVWQVPNAAHVGQKRPRLVCPRGRCRSGLDATSECQAHPACLIRFRSPARHDLSLSQRSERLPKQRSWELSQAAGLSAEQVSLICSSGR